ETPDGRPGVSVLLFAMDAAGVGKRLVERVGQCVMTCPTTACYSGLAGEREVPVGAQLRYFGDGLPSSKRPGGSRRCRGPAMDAAGVGKRLVERVGQCVMTCPTTACYSGLAGEKEVPVGAQLRYFGDGFQIAKRLDGRLMWRVPVMDGEFVVDDSFGVQRAV